MPGDLNWEVTLYLIACWSTSVYNGGSTGKIQPGETTGLG